MGNPLLHDDAFGLYVVQLLQKKYEGLEGFSVRSVETSPANFISKLRKENPKNFILVDASDMGIDGGELRRFPLSRLEGTAFTSHDFPIEMLLADALSDDCSATVIAVQPVFCGMGIEELTEPVKIAAERCARLIAECRIEEITELA